MEVTGSQIAQLVAQAPPNVITQTRVVCSDEVGEGQCLNPNFCAAPPGSIRNTIYLSEDGGQTFTESGEACLVPGETLQDAPVITPELVATAFQNLTWPQSPLQIQPPGGRTLVNLETNFFTTNTAATSQTVPLLGQQVEIEATPASWTWHHGDGSDQSTSSPGTAYPRLTVTHTYLDADVTVAPSVDTTYSGRYRIGGGGWVAIPATRTMTGDAGQLDVVSARPQLVAAP